jgi:ubiquinone/menaquinone biosynthesis C-methylase UbiE
MNTDRDESLSQQAARTLKGAVRTFVPAPVRARVHAVRASLQKRYPGVAGGAPSAPAEQDLATSWDPDMARMLDTWGEGSTWDEVQMLLMNCEGRALDIACGTGKTMEILAGVSALEIQGCDISDFLISKATERGISADRLQVADATKLPYADDSFDYSYSIGSLEHFTLQGIDDFVAQAHRVTKKGSFHMIPVSRSGRDEGWMKTVQSFHNNSVSWWLDHFRASYPRAYMLNSKWEDAISVGKWVICHK